MLGTVGTSSQLPFPAASCIFPRSKLMFTPGSL